AGSCRSSDCGPRTPAARASEAVGGRSTWPARSAPRSRPGSARGRRRTPGRAATGRDPGTGRRSLPSRSPRSAWRDDCTAAWTRGKIPQGLPPATSLWQTVAGATRPGYTRICMSTTSADQVLEALRERGLRMTPQRRAIVREIMSTNGHISPPDVARRVRERVPGVNPSTIYRTLDLLEELGILSHAHLESGAEYHRRAEATHVHLTCSRCGADDALSMGEAAELEAVVSRHRGFQPDLTHFAISGVCARCQRELAKAASPRRDPRSAVRPS